jgi:hypothetical protein
VGRNVPIAYAAKLTVAPDAMIHHTVGIARIRRIGRSTGVVASMA